MASKTDISNLALTRSRVGTIGDFNENSVEAQKCRVLYPMAVGHMLEKYPWRFARTVRALALTGNKPVDWNKEYDYPTDCLRVQYLLHNTDGQAALKGLNQNYRFNPILYEVGTTQDETTKTILADEDQLYVVYTRRITNHVLFSEQFIQCLAWYMASDLALSFGGDSAAEYRNVALSEFKRAFAEATAQDANQAQKATKTMPENLAVRSSSMPSHYHMNGQFYRRS